MTTPHHPRSTVRRVTLLAASALLVSMPALACRDDGASDDAADERRVVTLDEFAGLAALTIGVTPVHVDAVFGYSTAAAVFDHLGVDTGTAGTDGVDLESVAALRPTDIIGVSIPTTAAAEPDLDEIAPTTVIEYTSTWQEQLTATGAALDEADAAAEVIADVEQAIAELKGDLQAAGKAGTTVSIIGANSGELFALSRTGAVGSLLTQLGLGRPPAQDVDTEPTNPFVPMSPEELGDHDADVVVVLSGGAYPLDEVTGSPLWDTLGAVQNDAVAPVAAEPWFSPNAYGVNWILDDLRAILLGDGAVGTNADAVARWTALTAP